MKQIYLLLSILLIPLVCFSQQAYDTQAYDTQAYENQAYKNHTHMTYAQHQKENIRIDVTQNKTSHLVFPSNIIYVDIGDAKHFAADYTNNVLRIKGSLLNEYSKTIPSNDIPSKTTPSKAIPSKAIPSKAIPPYPSTNLTVICHDKWYYSFSVQYVQQENLSAPNLNYFIHQTDAIQAIGVHHSPPKVPPKEDTHDLSLNEIPLEAQTIQTNTYQQQKEKKENRLQKQIHQNAYHILQQKTLYHDLADKHADIKLHITGIYHSLHHCYIKYQIQNKSPIPYDIDYIEFGIQEKKRPKRSALNEQRLYPIFILNGDIDRVLPMRIERYVAVFDKIALSKDRVLYLEVIEGGRNMRVQIPFGRLQIEPI